MASVDEKIQKTIDDFTLMAARAREGTLDLSR